MKVIAYDKELNRASKPIVLGDGKIFFDGDIPMPIEFVRYSPNRFELRPVLEGVELELRVGHDNSIWVYVEEELSPSMTIPRYHFPSIKPGEAVKARIIIEDAV